MELNIDNWIIFRTKHFQRNKTQLRDCWFLCFAINKIYRFALIIICRNLKKNCDNIQNMLTIFVHFFFHLCGLGDMAATKLKEKTTFSFQISVTRICLFWFLKKQYSFYFLKKGKTDKIILIPNHLSKFNLYAHIWSTLKVDNSQ